MRINAITNVNYRTGVKRVNHSKKEDTPVASEVNFKGLKGALTGTAAGAGYVALMCAISGPLMPLTAGLLALGCGAGAIAGHNIEDDWKEDKKNSEKND